MLFGRYRDDNVILGFDNKREQPTSASEEDRVWLNHSKAGLSKHDEAENHCRTSYKSEQTEHVTPLISVPHLQG